MKKIILSLLFMSAAAAGFSQPTTRALIGKDTMNLSGEIKLRITDLRNNGGVLEQRVNGIWVPKFALAAGGGGNTIFNDTLHLSSTNDVQTWSIQQPSTYGITYPGLPHNLTRMDRWYDGYATFPGVNPSGRPNVVRYMGYNVTPEGGRVNNGDAGWQMRWETHFENIDGYLFEFHLPELIDTAGIMHRLFSLYANKQTGKTYIQSAVDSHQWFTHNNPSTPYAVIDPGRLILQNNQPGGSANVVLADPYSDLTANVGLSGGVGSLSLFRNIGISPISFNVDGISKFNFMHEPAIKNNGSLLIGENSLIYDPGAVIDTSAIFELRSISKALLLPRLTTTQQNAVSGPAEGLMLYNKTLHAPGYFNGAQWNTLGINLTTTGSTGAATWDPVTGTINVPQYAATSQWTNSGSDINFTGGKVGIGTTSPAEKLHIYSTGTADNLSIDGTSFPAISFKDNGTVKGYNFLASSGGGFMSNSEAGDIGILSASNNILFGRGYGAATMKVGNAVVIGGDQAVSSAIFDVQTTTKGTRPVPEMTQTQRDAISSPANGLQIFNTTTGNFQFYYSPGGAWFNSKGYNNGRTTLTLNGSQTTFAIPHGFGFEPTSFSLTFSDGSITEFTTALKSMDNSDIIITCSTAPPSGSVTVYWQAFL